MNHVICDLDGVLWRGRTMLPGAEQSLRRLKTAGLGITFATNNSTKGQDEVAKKIRDVVGYAATPEDVLTSAMAAASLLDESVNSVLIVGEDGIHQAITDRGIEVTTNPSRAQAVVVGLSRDLSYDQLADAARAIRSGARFIATNDDPTFPTASGLDPGSGAIVAAIERASGVVPEVAGKPNPAMVKLLLSAGIEQAWVIGDRLDTDIALASQIDGWRPILVLSGVTSAQEADAQRIENVVADFKSAVDLVLSDDHRS